MPLVSMRELLENAEENNYAIPAFNVNNLEQIKAVMEAAKTVRAPVIIQMSSGAIRYAGEGFVPFLIKGVLESYPYVPFAVHQDHGISPEVCRKAINLGFSSVMMDGSLEENGTSPSNFHYNVKVTQKVVAFAHKVGVTVEGELGCLGSLETGSSSEEDGIGAVSSLSNKQMLTDPQEAKLFAEETKVDALAIAIGTSHGAYKFTKEPTGEILDIERIKKIKSLLPNTYLVMHGASSVPSELVKIINEFGGNLKKTYGVPISQIKLAIKYGIRKINVDTDIRLGMTGAVRKFMFEQQSKFDMREWLQPAINAATEICKNKYLEFGCENMAAKIKCIPLSKMCRNYEN